MTPEEKEQRKKEKARIEKIKADVFRMYLHDMPRVGPELTAFIAQQTEYYDVDEEIIVDAIAVAQRKDIQIRLSAAQAVMQQQMEIFPDMTVKALRAIYRNLDAKERIPIRGTRGDVKTDENGNVLFIEKENHRAQLEAADIVMKISAGYAPKQLEIESHNTHEHRHISDSDILEGFRRIFNLRGIETEVKALPVGAPAGSGIIEQIGNGGGREECILLADTDNGNDR